MTTAWARWDGDDLVLSVKVQPRASRDALVPEPGRLRVRITAPPVEGAANAHLARLLAREFGVAPSRVALVRGESSRDKVFRIQGPTEIPAVLGSLVPTR